HLLADLPAGAPDEPGTPRLGLVRTVRLVERRTERPVAGRTQRPARRSRAEPARARRRVVEPQPGPLGTRTARHRSAGLHDQPVRRHGRDAPFADAQRFQSGHRPGRLARDDRFAVAGRDARHRGRLVAPRVGTPGRADPRPRAGPAARRYASRVVRPAGRVTRAGTGAGAPGRTGTRPGAGPAGGAVPGAVVGARPAGRTGTGA